MNFYMPTKIIVENGSVAKNTSLFATYGKKCLVVTGKSSAKLCGALDDVISALEKNNITYKIFDKVTQNPLISTCIEGGNSARDFGAEFVVGIGGGSPLDAAKAMAVFATNDIDEEGLYSSKWDNDPLPTIAVGTTAGTGSEVTQIGVITDSNGRKRSFRADVSFPVIAFGDTNYTKCMPDKVMRSTAIDALSHCIESYFSNNSTDISRAHAVLGAKNIVKVFKEIVDGKDLDDDMRTLVYEGSIHGGIAISITGTSFCHALGYFLSEDHGVAHGTACGMYLPEFVRYNTENAKELADKLFAEIDVDRDTLCDIINKVMPEVDINVSEAEKDEVAERWINAACLKKMYGNPTSELLDSIVRKIV